MKLQVHRQLSSGFYRVAFEVTDFTQEELQKMSSFGVPTISIQQIGPGNAPVRTDIRLNQINKNMVAAFHSEDEAKKYEETVVNQVRAALKKLRDSQDKFTSSEEVPL